VSTIVSLIEVCEAMPLGGGGTANAVTEGVSYTTVEYSYDTRGNILSKTYSDGENTTVVSYAYNGAWKDQLTSFNGTAISYDAIGNPENWINGETFTWQHGRQLASYAKDGKTITYTYNSDGIRTSKTETENGVSTTTTYNVVDGVLRSLTKGNITLKFLDNQILYSDPNGTTSYWYVQNAQKDIIGIIDSTGNYVVQYTYDSWGNPLTVTSTLPEGNKLATLNPFRYRGYIYDDETGFYYCQSRYYDPEVGRWLNADDVISGVGGDIRGYNAFSYCFNNPCGYIDHLGHFPGILIFIGVVTAASGLAGFLYEPAQKEIDVRLSTSILNTEIKPSLPPASIDVELPNTFLSPYKPVFPSQLPPKTEQYSMWAYNSNMQYEEIDETALTTGDRLKNAALFATAGLMASSGIGMFAGAVGTLASASVLGASGVQTFAISALGFDIPAMFLYPLFGMEVELVEYG